MQALPCNDDSIIIVTSSKLIHLNKNKTIAVLLDNTFWSGLYPNSIIIGANNYIYIGMRQGVAKWHIGDRPDLLSGWFQARNSLMMNLYISIKKLNNVEVEDYLTYVMIFWTS